MFDLTAAIAAWRKELSAGSCRPPDVDELESHLRDEVESLRSDGLSEQEAFWVARHRLGDTTALLCEYAKAVGPRPYLNSFFWIAAGVLGYQVFIAASKVVGWSSAYLAYRAGARGYALGAIQSVAYLSTLITACMSAIWGLTRGRELMARIARKFVWRLGVGALLGLGFLLSAVLIVVPAGSALPAARVFSPRDLGVTAMVWNYAELAWKLLFLTFLLVASVHLRRRMSASPETSPS